MVRITKYAALAFFFFSGCIYFLSAPVDGSLLPAASVNAFSDGAEIFSANCAKCHGMDGRAKTAKGKRAGATDFTSDWNRNEARGIRIITNGKDQMPSFKNKLSAAEIKSVFNYVLRFR